MERVEQMKKLPSKSRSKIAINYINKKGAEYWVDLEIKDDPQNPAQVIFLFYDISEIGHIEEPARRSCAAPRYHRTKRRYQSGAKKD